MINKQDFQWAVDMGKQFFPEAEISLEPYDLGDSLYLAVKIGENVHAFSIAEFMGYPSQDIATPELLCEALKAYKNLVFHDPIRQIQ